VAAGVPVTAGLPVAAGLPVGRRRCAVLGHPIGHSLSPVLHRAAYAALDLDWTYEAVDVTGDALAGFLDGLDPSWRGLSLTMPLKRAVLPMLDVVDPLARTVGAANTVVLDEDGRTGSNTDVGGLLGALAAVGIGAPGPGAATRAPTSCLVLGGGATAASTVVALSRLRPREIVVAVRDRDRAAPVLALAASVGTPVRAADLAAARSWGRPDLVVATLPAGAADGLAAAVADCVTPGGVVFDVVYDGWPSTLARAATAAGATVLSGLDLLVHQAAGQVAAFTGVQVPVGVLEAALAAAGLPGPAGTAASASESPRG